MVAAPTEEIYSADYLKNLFDEMQGSYERVSNVSSFGFNRRWRKQYINLLALEPGMTVCDLMTGTGETWIYILPKIGVQGCLYSIDFSPVMVQNANRRKNKMSQYAITVSEEDALQSSLPSGSMDVVTCTYGLKTLAPELKSRFVAEIGRILKPGGQVAMVEISIPDNPLLRAGYYGYLKWFIPWVGKLFLGNHENYKTLSRYLGLFRNCRAMQAEMERQGFSVRYVPLFFGCATALIATRPSGA